MVWGLVSLLLHLCASACTKYFIGAANMDDDLQRMCTPACACAIPFVVTTISSLFVGSSHCSLIKTIGKDGLS